MPSDWSLRRAEAIKLTSGLDAAVAQLAAGAWGVVSASELLALGMSRDAILTRLRRGNLHLLHRGVYAVGHRNVTTEGRFLAAVKACGPDAVLSHYAAACLYGWLRYDGRPIDVTAPVKRNRPMINAHRSDLVERELYRQIPVTPRVRTITDLARIED